MKDQVKTVYVYIVSRAVEIVCVGGRQAPDRLSEQLQRLEALLKCDRAENQLSLEAAEACDASPPTAAGSLLPDAWCTPTVTAKRRVKPERKAVLKNRFEAFNDGEDSDNEPEPRAVAAQTTRTIGTCCRPRRRSLATQTGLLRGGRLRAGPLRTGSCSRGNGGSLESTDPPAPDAATTGAEALKEHRSQGHASYDAEYLAYNKCDDSGTNGEDVCIEATGIEVPTKLANATHDAENPAHLERHDGCTQAEDSYSADGVGTEGLCDAGEAGDIAKSLADCEGHPPLHGAASVHGSAYDAESHDELESHAQPQSIVCGFCRIAKPAIADHFEPQEIEHAGSHRAFCKACADYHVMNGFATCCCDAHCRLAGRGWAVRASEYRVVLGCIIVFAIRALMLRVQQRLQ